MNVTELVSYKAKDIKEMDVLMHELSQKSCCTDELLRSAVEDPNSHIYVIRDKETIVASACLCVAHTTEHVLGFIEAVVVLSDYRGQHLGRRLVEHIIAEAKNLGIDSLHMTSNPRRITANNLYRSLGFELYDTNVYKMKL